MWAHIDQWCEHAGLIRVFEDGQEFDVDGYEYMFPFRMYSPDEIELTGMCCRVCTASEARAMLRAVRERGWTATWRRVSGAKPGIHEARQGVRRVDRKRV